MISQFEWSSEFFKAMSFKLGFSWLRAFCSLVRFLEIALKQVFPLKHLFQEQLMATSSPNVSGERIVRNEQVFLSEIQPQPELKQVLTSIDNIN